MTRSLTITIHVSPAEAARLGRAQCGDVALPLTDAILADLGPERREALACHLDPPQGAHERVRALWGRPLAHCAPPVGEASVETLARLLDARRDEVEAVEAELAAERAEREVAAGDAREVIAALSAEALVRRDPHHRDGARLAALRDVLAGDLLARLDGAVYGLAAGAYAGRGEEADAVLARVRRDLAADREIDRQLREAREAAEAARAQAEREALVAWLADGSATVREWATARLADDESDHAVRAAVRDRVLDVLVAAGVLGPGRDRDLGPGRWGHLHDVPADLDVYRAVVGLRASVPRALAEDGAPVADVTVGGVHRWRDARPDETGDDDGEVLVGEGIDVQVTLRGLDAPVRYRYLPGAG